MFDWVPNAPFIKFTTEKRNKEMNSIKEDAKQKIKKIKKSKGNFFNSVLISKVG